MQAMTSLQAQNQFGLLMDSAQREPVTITRHGRPFAVVQAYQDYQASHAAMPVEIAKMISENFPLRGKNARDRKSVV